MKAARFSLFGILAMGALALTGCNAEQDDVTSVGVTHTVVHTVTATATAPAARNTSTRAARHTTSGKSNERATADSVRAVEPTPHAEVPHTRAVQPLAAASTTASVPRTTSPDPVRTTQPTRRTTVQPPAPAKTTTNSGTCHIKGNISSEGEKIYHVPGQRYYDVTKISLGKGERWFCSESDAVAAGWRKALV